MRTKLHVGFLGVGCCLMVYLLMLGLGHAQVEMSASSLPPMSLTVIGLNGTSVVLNSTNIAGLPSVRGSGGVRLGIVDNYTGIAVTTLCDLVGGINNDSVVKITGSDNYSQTFSYDQVVNGNFTAYDPTTGNVTLPSEPLTLIIAYYKDDANLTTTGPLMVAIIGPESLGTIGKLWVWYAVQVQIMNASAVPEFQTLSITCFLLITTSIGIIISKKRWRSSTRARFPHSLFFH